MLADEYTGYHQGHRPVAACYFPGSAFRDAGFRVLGFGFRVVSQVEA